MTDNHAYNTPAKGETDWDVPLNDNFERLDTDVEIRDTEANRGSYTPKAGAKFFATDSGAIFIGDGANWSRLASSGETPEFDTVQADTVTATRIEADTVVTNDAGTTVWDANSQSIPSGSRTRIEFQNVEDDQRGQWDGTNHEIVVTEPGNYLVSAGLFWGTAPSAGTNHWFTARRNGNIGVAQAFASGAQRALQASRPALGVNAGDTFHLEVEQYEGSALTVGGNRTSTYLSVVQL